MSFSNVVRRAKSLLFVRYSNIISIQNNLSGVLFQNKSLIERGISICAGSFC